MTTEAAVPSNDNVSVPPAAPVAPAPVAAAPAEPPAQTQVATEEQPPQFPPFHVHNRSRAQRLARMILGPTARVWGAVKLSPEPGAPMGIGVRIGFQNGDKKNIVAEGKDFTDALQALVKSYLTTAPTFAEAQDRLWKVGNQAPVGNFQEETLGRFPTEYAALKKKIAAEKAAEEQAALARVMTRGTKN